jgi:hypothetical protein
MAYMMDESTRQLVCPQCRKPGNLWRGVYAHPDAWDDLPEDDECWHDVETVSYGPSGELLVTYAKKSPESLDPETDLGFRDWEYTDDFGCSECGWFGDRQDLRSWAAIRYGWDHRPLRAPMTGQLQLETT